MIKKKQKKSREEINALSRLLKRKKKHKGLPSGSRIGSNKVPTTQSNTTSLDPRIGSKKPIPLVPLSENKQPTTQPKPTAKSKHLSAEQELAQLEENLYLEQLLDLVEGDTPLTPKQQQDLDKMLNRIDELMQQLGYTDSFEDEQNEINEDIVSILKQRS